MVHHIKLSVALEEGGSGGLKLPPNFGAQSIEVISRMNTNKTTTNVPFEPPYTKISSYTAVYILYI